MRVFLVLVVLFLTAGLTFFSTAKVSVVPPVIVRSLVIPLINPLSISALRSRTYEGSDLTIEQTLSPKASYNRYVVSYQSDGLKIYGLLTVPTGQKPVNGWPVIIFNHGYIPPNQYSTVQSYSGYVDFLAQSGYIVFKPDYRGHDKSEGSATGAYFSNAYTIDVLNAVSSLKKYKDSDPTRIGMWGHSMGGQLTLRAIVTNPEIKASVIWGGVVAPYDYLVYNWRTNNSWRGLPPEMEKLRPSLENFLNLLGAPEVNKALYNSISPNSHLSNISGPVQLHHGLADDSVPSKFSAMLKDELTAANKPVELYEYPGADHNISQAYDLAMTRSVNFFGRYLKN